MKFKEYLLEEKIKIGSKYGNWTITQYIPITYDDFGSPNGGKVKLVNQQTYDEILIQNDLSLRINMWYISIKGIRIKDKKLETVINKTLKHINKQ